MLDNAFGLCIGCGRSGDEIACWVDMSPAVRRAIMEALPDRLKRLETEAAPDKAAS